MESNIEKILETIEEHFDESPKFIKENGFTRWGRNNRYWCNYAGTVAFIGDFVENIKIKVKLKEFNRQNTKEEVAKYLANLEEEKRGKADYIREMWEQIPFGFNDNGYLKSKKIIFCPPHIKSMKGWLWVPYFHLHYGLSGIQKIADNGWKGFEERSVIQGAFHPIPMAKVKDRKYLCIVEGYASGISAYNALSTLISKEEIMVLVAGSSGNILNVVHLLRNNLYNIKLFGIADNDKTSINAMRESNIPFFNIGLHFKDAEDGFDINDAMNNNKELTLKILKEKLNEFNII